MQRPPRRRALWPPASPNFPGAPSFELWQVLTYGFLHGSLTHLFFNMFALWMFGGEIERLLGTRRFVTYHLVCVVGAAVAQLLVVGGVLTTLASVPLRTGSARVVPAAVAAPAGVG